MNQVEKLWGTLKKTAVTDTKRIRPVVGRQKANKSENTFDLFKHIKQ